MLRGFQGEGGVGRASKMTAGTIASRAPVRLTVVETPKCLYNGKSYQIKPKSDSIYHFPIDLKPNERRFDSKSIGK